MPEAPEVKLMTLLVQKIIGEQIVEAKNIKAIICLTL